MERNRRLGQDILISKLGFGAWAIGGGAYGGVAVTDANEALDYYLSQGGNFIDTAQMYANSEEIIGNFLQDSEYKNDVVIATKTPCGDGMNTVNLIESELDKSLKKLKRNYVDLYYFHSPSEDDETIAAGLEVMKSLKAKGKIRTIGASIKGVNVTDETVELCRRYIDTKEIDAIQLVYSIFRQKNKEIFSYAQDNNVALIGRTSLESGFLTGKYRKGHVFAEGDHRVRWSASVDEIMDEVQKIEKKYIGKHDDSMTSLAIRFAMHPDEITDTIVGVKNKKQMEEIIQVCEKQELNASALIALELMFQDKTKMFNVR
ncbi:MAG: aldo/keto reductase [Eubacteriales bacterium]